MLPLASPARALQLRDTCLHEWEAMVARIRNRQEPVTNWLAAGFLATALWVGLAAMVITGRSAPPGVGWNSASRKPPMQRTFVRAAQRLEVR
jgi:hypothetical protein